MAAGKKSVEEEERTDGGLATTCLVGRRIGHGNLVVVMASPSEIEKPSVNVLSNHRSSKLHDNNNDDAYAGKDRPRETDGCYDEINEDDFIPFTTEEDHHRSRQNADSNTTTVSTTSSSSTLLPSLQRHIGLSRLPAVIQQVCNVVKDNFRDLWRFTVELFIYVCDIYHVERDWEKMGVRFRFRVIDAVLNLLILSPLTVLFYFCTWACLDHILLDRLPTIGAWALLSLGIGVETLAGYLQRPIKQKLGRKLEPGVAVGYNFAAVGFRYVIAVANACHMRAVSQLLFLYVGYDAYNSFRTLATTLVILVSLKCMKNVLAAPLSIALDTDTEDFGHVPSLNNVEPDLTIPSLLDHLISHALVHSLVHAHWQGTWSFMDNLFESLRPFLDVTFTWSLSSCLLLIFLLSQLPSTKSNNQLTGTLITSTWYFSANVVTVLWWRAVWMFFDSLGYYFPIWHRGWDVTCIYGHVLSFGLMTACYASSTVMGLGCEKETTPGDIKFYTSFFSEFFKDEIDKLSGKEREPEKEEKQKVANGVPAAPLAAAAAQVKMRKKPVNNPDTREIRTKKRTSLEDVVKADYREKELKEKAKKKKH